MFPDGILVLKAGGPTPVSHHKETWAGRVESDQAHIWLGGDTILRRLLDLC